MKLVLNSPTPLDDVFRTEGEKMKEWFIPIINEVYGTSYKVSQATILMQPNEQMHEAAVDTDDVDQKGIPKKITDMSILVEGHVYHLECQSLEDGTIVIRLVEYGLFLAVRNANLDKKTGVLNVNLPRQLVLYLRRREAGKSVEVNYRYDDQQIRVLIPGIPVQKYSIRELFEKKLYLLIPYYMMRYEEQFETGAGIENPRIREDLEELNERLYSLSMDEEFPFIYVRYLAELSQTVMKHITPKVEKEKREGLVKSMGGTVLELETDRILKIGEERGEKRGEERGEKRGEERGILIGEERGEERGILIGEKRGKIIGRVLSMHEDGHSVQEIANRVQITTKEVQNILNTERF